MNVTGSASHPRVAILLASCNGAALLREQLDSLATQTYRPGLILVSDDGSTDGTCDIVRSFAAAHPDLDVVLRDGPRRGAAQNFLSLLRHVPDEVDIAAFSDQDDVWLPEKLARGVAALGALDGAREVALYCGRSWECDAQLSRKSLSRGLLRPACFRHALVQNVAAGNTMMMNRATLDLVQAISGETGPVVVHDWWLYQVVSGVGGRVIFDPEPLLLYRQHDRNLIGANRGAKAKGRRLRMMLSGEFRTWNNINIRALRAVRHRLTPENRHVLDTFAEGRNGPVLTRLATLRRTGLYRQGIQGRASLWLAALLRRM